MQYLFFITYLQYFNPSQQTTWHFLSRLSIFLRFKGWQVLYMHTQDKSYVLFLSFLILIYCYYRLSVMNIRIIAFYR